VLEALTPAGLRQAAVTAPAGVGLLIGGLDAGEGEDAGDVSPEDAEDVVAAGVASAPDPAPASDVLEPAAEDDPAPPEPVAAPSEPVAAPPVAARRPRGPLARLSAWAQRVADALAAGPQTDDAGGPVRRVTPSAPPSTGALEGIEGGVLLAWPGEHRAAPDLLAVEPAAVEPAAVEPAAVEPLVAEEQPPALPPLADEDPEAAVPAPPDEDPEAVDLDPPTDASPEVARDQLSPTATARIILRGPDRPDRPDESDESDESDETHLPSPLLLVLGAAVPPELLIGAAEPLLTGQLAEVGAGAGAVSGIQPVTPPAPD
jgi:hypothetical protein